MLDNNTKKALDELISKIFQGNVALFLGAGVSHATGGPVGNKLTEMIKVKFPNINQKLYDFIEVCQDVIDTPPYNRDELEEYIHGVLGSLQPTKYHQSMTKYDWSAIFTTNFDDLVELTYRVYKDRLKPCKAIYSDFFQVNPADKSKVCLFKIMGSITATSNETGNMVLSRADCNRALLRRRKYFEIVSDFVKSGTILFIGYSFGDRIVLDVIDDLIDIYGKDRVPWSYALFKDLPDSDRKTQYMLSSRKIIPLQCDFENFCQFLELAQQPDVKAKRRHSVRLKIRGADLEIGEDESRQYAEYFDILTEEKINTEAGSKDSFFMGTNESWGAYAERWDFLRDVYTSSGYKPNSEGGKAALCIKERVLDELRKYEVDKNKAIVIRGMAGVGKTTLLKRLAYDTYKSGETPVIVVKPTRISFDYRLLATFIEDLNYQFNQKLSKGQHAPPIKPLILFDDAGSMIRHVSRLKDYLTSRGRPALIVAAERTAEWDLNWKSFPFKIPKENIYELDEQLSQFEQKRIIDHLYDIGYIKAKGIFWNDIIDRTFENSFFATIYTLVHPSRKQFNDIIKDQYNNLTELTKKAYEYICCFHQFDIPINIELLVRALRCSYSDFDTEIIAKDANKVIFEEEDGIGNVLYRTHHRIIAKKTIDLFLNDPEILKTIYSEVFREANLNNKKEREICEKLLVQHLGPNAKPQLFSYEQQRHLFQKICTNNCVRTLIHHWGVLESDDKNYSQAEELLKRALEIPRDDIEAFRGESDQNILTSLGSLYSHTAIDFLKKQNLSAAEEYFRKAEECFHGAKYGEFPNSYAYHSHAYMWLLRGNQATELSQQLYSYAHSLEILSIARDNLNEEELQPIYELQTLIWSKIGDEGRIRENLDVLLEKYNSARGYYLIGEHLWRRAQEKEGQERKNISKEALAVVKEGLEFIPNDEYCLRLQSRLLKELEPANIDNFYQSLRKWKAASSIPSAWLLYELGRASFIIGYYDFSKEYFSELETGVGMGHRLRSKPRHPVLDENGHKVEYEGSVLKINTSYDGILRCDSLRNLKYPLAFRPVASKFTPSSGDLVRFSIEFSYRGPRATNVKKI